MAWTLPAARTVAKRAYGWTRRHAAELAASAFGAGWFAYLGYGPTLAPTHIGWMMRDDWAAYFWGFAFYRNAPWRWPLGATPDLFWPFGTSIGFTDANPWVSLLAKPFSPLLPLDFQLFGAWFLLCFVLQGWFGARLSAAFSDDPVQRALGGMLFAVTPLLPARNPHIALCGFFLLTAGLALYLRPLGSRAELKGVLTSALALLGWAAGTHGYLSLMLLVLMLALCARLAFSDRLLRAHELALAMLAAVAVTLAVYGLFGYLGWKKTELTAEGFGEFSGDLTALINPQGWSRWVQPLPFTPRQWEGFAYLGCGVLALLGLRVALWLGRPWTTLRQLGRMAPLLLSLLAMWFYSLSFRVSYRGAEVLNLHALYAPFASLTGIFRSSGRFAWPLHLSLIAAGVSACGALPRRWLGRTVLCAAVALQAAEIDPQRLSFHDVPLHPLQDPVWETVSADYQHLALVPIHLLWVCRYDPQLVNRLSYEAYRRRITFNSGNVMRKEPAVATLCERHVREWPRLWRNWGLAWDGRPTNNTAERAGRPRWGIDPHTVYVVDPQFRDDFKRDAVCGIVEGLLVCASSARETPLLTALRRDPR